MKKNLYLTIIKEQYLLLIIAPIVIISGLIYYSYCYSIDGSVLTQLILADLPIALFIIYQTINIFIELTKKVYTEAFAQTIRLLIVFITIIIWGHYLGKGYAIKQGIKYFQLHRDHYMKIISKRSPQIKEGDYPLMVFPLRHNSQQLVYDKTDKYFNPKVIIDLSSKEVGECGKIVKIEPHFYIRQNCERNR